MKARFGFLGALVAITTAAAVFPALRAFFMCDDLGLISGVIDGGPLGLWTRNDMYFRPVISLSLWLDHWLWGLNPVGYHLSNLVLHIVNSLLVVMAAFLLFPRDENGGRGLAGAWIAGLLFAALPCHAEAVAWISGRTDVAAAFFALVSLCGFLWFRRESNSAAAVLTLVGFAGGLCTKESVLLLPGAFFLLLLPGVMSGRVPRRSWWLLGALVAAQIAYFPIRSAALGGVHMPGAGDLFTRGVWNPFLELLAFFGRTLWPGIWPAEHLPANWPLDPRADFMTRFFAVAGSILCLGAAAVSWAGRRRRAADWAMPAALCLAALGTQLPSLAIGLQFETRVGERYLYVPSIFAALLAARFLAQAGVMPRVRRAMAVVLVVLHFAVLHQTCRIWRQGGDLALDVLASLRELPKDEPVLLVLPDHLRGALVYRNGLEHSCQAMGIPGAWRPCGLAALISPQDEFSVEATPLGYELKPMNPSCFVFPEDEFADAVVVPDDHRSAFLPFPGKPLAFYSAGRMQMAPRH